MSETVREPYELDVRFEACVLFYAASNAKFYRLVGKELEPECLALPCAKAALEALRQMAKEEVPSSCLGLLQRLQSLVVAGKLTAETPAEVDAVFESVLELQPAPPSADAVAAEMLPLLKRRLQSKAVLLGHQQWGSRGDFSVVEQALERARRLGHVEDQPGVRVAASGFQAIQDVADVERLPTGVFELDSKIGGLWRGALGVWLARSGGGKSMALIHQTGTAILQKRRFTGFVSLELPQSLQLARLYAHLTGVPVNMILDSDAERAEAKRRIEMIESVIGLCEVAEFPAHGTTPADIDSWIESREQLHGRKMEVLVVDYGDLLTAHVPGRDQGDYLVMRHVYKGLSTIAKKRQMWVWTASQASRGKGTKHAENEYLDLENVADSMNKSRIADMVLSLNPRDGGQVEIFVGKHRLSQAGYAVGPLMTEFDVARLTPWAKQMFSWGV